MRPPAAPQDRQILKEATTPLVDLRLVRSLRGDAIVRESCPDGQFYLVTQGVWRFDEEGPATRVSTMGFSYSAPGQPCLRTAEETVVAFGIQVRAKALSDRFKNPIHNKDDKHIGWEFKRSYMRLMTTFVIGGDPVDIEDEIVLLMRTPEPKREDRIPKWLREARDLLHSESSESQSLSSIAGRIGITPTHLSSSFHAAFGVPFATYRRRIKIERTLDRAAKAGYTMSAAAIDAGFYDASHFYRACQSELGMEPALLSKVLQTSKIESLYKTSA